MTDSTIDRSPDGLRQLSAAWRDDHPGHSEGVVLVWEGLVYGWKDCLRDPGHERPGAFAIDADGHVFVAEGGDDDAGAKVWRVWLG